MQLHSQVSYSWHLSLHLPLEVQSTNLLKTVYTLNIMRMNNHAFKSTQCLWCPVWDCYFCFALQSFAAQRSNTVTLLSSPLTEDIKRRRYEEQVVTNLESLLHAWILPWNEAQMCPVFLVWFGCVCSRITNIWKTGRKGIWMAWDMCCFCFSYNAEHWR